ncbi:hypothetical protein VDGL01_06915 [Verticillium dahliae]
MDASLDRPVTTEILVGRGIRSDHCGVPETSSHMLDFDPFPTITDMRAKLTLDGRDGRLCTAGWASSDVVHQVGKVVDLSPAEIGKSAHNAEDADDKDRQLARWSHGMYEKAVQG